MTSDQKQFLSNIQKSNDGTILNPIQLKNLDSSNVETIGKQLNKLSKEMNTRGEYRSIGNLYGFTLLIKTEASMKDEFDFNINRFFVLGTGDIKYTYNNGLMATDPQLAASNFLNALYKIPSLLEQEQQKLKENEQHIPTLNEVVNATWRKESELKDLKLELTVLDKTIKASISSENSNTTKNNQEKEPEWILKR